MQFKNFLNEKTYTDDEIYDILHRDCSQFIKKGKRLYRGHKSNQTFFEKTTRKNRKAVDTPQVLNDLIDLGFKKKFGWKPRSEGVYTTPYKDIASMYGIPYLFFPVDGYKYLWSPDVYDILIVIKKQFHEYILKNYDVVVRGSSIIDNIDNITKDQYDEFMKGFEKNYLNSYMNNKIQMNKKNEVMVKCDKYYMLNYRYYKTWGITDLENYF